MLIHRNPSRALLRRSRALGLLLAMIVAPAFAEDAAEPETPPPPEPKQEIVGTWDAWSKICIDAGDDQRRCQLVQSASDNSSGQLVFQTAIGYVDGEERPIMFMTAPLGIFLPKGIAVVIDDDEEGMIAQVQRCDANGCLAMVNMTPELVSRMQKGKAAKIYVGVNADRNVPLPLDLTGFTKAFKALGEN